MFYALVHFKLALVGVIRDNYAMCFAFSLVKNFIQAKHHFISKLCMVTGTSYHCALHLLFLLLLTGVSQNSGIYYSKSKSSR